MHLSHVSIGKSIMSSNNVDVHLYVLHEEIKIPLVEFFIILIYIMSSHL
jgi:hypothetical protein